jgi:hypothetical protein
MAPDDDVISRAQQIRGCVEGRLSGANTLVGSQTVEGAHAHALDVGYPQLRVVKPP